MSAEVLLVTEVPVARADTATVAEKWASAVGADREGRALYRGVEADTILELRSVDLAEFDQLRDEWTGLNRALAPSLEGDFRRILYEFVESPRPGNGPLPDTVYVQLRRVEVRPPVMAEYRAWRERTIFETVRSAAEIRTFVAYHSLVAAHPGVLFVSGFDGDPAAHRAVFETPEYEAILGQARSRYIRPDSGDRGLSTATYARVW